MKRTRYILTIAFSLLCLVATLYVLTTGGAEQPSRVEVSWEAPASVEKDTALVGFWEDSLQRMLPPDAQPSRR